MRASGLHGVSLSAFDVDEKEEDVLDSLLTERRCQDLVKACARLTQNGDPTFLEPYPLADKKTGKKFRACLLRLWGLLIEKAKHEVVFDQMLIPWCIEWLCIVSASNHRGMRHTGTEVAMSLMVSLTELFVDIQSKKTVKLRQGANKKRMANTSKADAAELDARASSLEELVETIFKGIFLQRYRDTHDEVRVCCLNALGRCITLNKQSFLKDTYLKYLGWLLHDRLSANVRVTALQQLQVICKASAVQRDQLRHFVQRFEKRFIEMCRDVETKVCIDALRLLNQLYELDLLSDKRQTVIHTLGVLPSCEPALVRALAPLLQKHISENEAGEVCIDISRKLVKLAALICNHESSAGSQQRAEVCDQLVRVMAPQELALSDWTTFMELLLSDSPLINNNNINEEALQTVLLHLMVARASEPHTTEVETLAMLTEAGKSLPQLLIAFGSCEQQLLPVLMLVQRLQMDTARHTLKGSNFIELLHQLEVVYFKHHNHATLDACAGAWRRLLEQSAAPALQEQALVQYKRLCNKLLKALEPLSRLVCKKGADIREAEVALSRFTLMARVGPPETRPSLAILHGLPAKLIDALEARPSASKGVQSLTNCLQGLLQLQTSMLLDVVAHRYQKRTAGGSDDELAVESERILIWSKELLPVFVRVLGSHSRPLRLVGFELLSLVLVALSLGGEGTPIHDEAVTKALVAARRALIDTLRLLLEESAGAEQEVERPEYHDESLGRNKHLRSPVWLNCALRCALRKGVPLADVLIEMLYSATKSQLVASLCKLFVTEKLSKCPLVEQAKIGVSVLISAFERVAGSDDDDYKDLQHIAEQLAWLHSHQRASASQLSARVLELGIEHGLALIEQTTVEQAGAFMDSTLTPLLGCLSQDLASKLFSKLEVHLEQSKNSRLGRFISHVKTVKIKEGSAAWKMSKMVVPKGGAYSKSKRARDEDEYEDDDEDVGAANGKQQRPSKRHAWELVGVGEQGEEEPWDGEIGVFD